MLLSGDELLRGIGTPRLIIVGDVGDILHVLVCVRTHHHVIEHFTGAPLDTRQLLDIFKVHSRRGSFETWGNFGILLHFEIVDRPS